MTADLLFDIVSAAVLPGWALLLLLPRWRHSQTVAFGITIPILALTYTVLLVRLSLGGGFDPSAFESLDGVMGLLGDRYGMVAGWTHFLAFDLFVGAWVVRDAGSRGVPHLLCVVPLLLTFLAGPLGLLLYLLVRQIRARSVIPQPSEGTR